MVPANAGDTAALPADDAMHRTNTTARLPCLSRAGPAVCRVLPAVLFASLFLAGQGCATIRITDPPRTATEQFLLTGATSEAVQQLSTDPLRDRLVWVETRYLSDTREIAGELSFLIGEVRAKLLESGVRLVDTREGAEVVLEIRSGGLGVDRLDFLLGVPAGYLAGFGGSVGPEGVPIATPELAIVKSTRQNGFASVALVAYVAKTGELLATSGPFVGRTNREDFWLFGVGPRTVGNIPPTERERRSE